MKRGGYKQHKPVLHTTARSDFRRCHHDISGVRGPLTRKMMMKGLMP